MRLPFLLLALVSLAFAEGEYAIVSVAAMLAVFIVAIGYMASQYLQNPQLELWAKNEWKELIIAGLTVGLAYAAIMLYTGQILGLTTGYADQSTLISEVEQKFLKFEQNLSTDYRHAIKVANRLGMLASYSYTATGGYIFYIGQMNGPFVGTSGLMQEVALLTGNLSNGILVYEAMVLFMRFFSYASFVLIMPVGMALRFIPPTRKMGGTLMALALAGIFIFPFAMALVANIHDNIKVTHSKITPVDLEKITLKLPNTLSELCTNDFIRFFTAINEWGWWAAICFIFCPIWAAPCMYAYAACYAYCIMPVTGYCWNTVSYPFFNGVQTAYQLATSILLVSAAQDITNTVGPDATVLYHIVMDKLVIPASTAASVPIMEAVLVAALTIVGARSISGALGGEIAITGLERLV